MMKSSMKSDDDTATGDVVDIRLEANSASVAQSEMLNDMLLTVNAHLATALTDLEVAYCDLNGLIEATQVAAIFVDGAMLVRKFTPALAALFNLNARAVGMPLTHISDDLDLSDFAADFDHACRAGKRLEKYVALRDGPTHCLMTIHPYRGAGRGISGAVITVTRLGVSYSGQA
jgi:two-component system CheB/CheR fusion protein